MKEADYQKTIEMVAVVAGCIITREGKYLLVQERQQRAYGLWNLPAGHVDKGESIKAAAKREALEEVGFEVKLVKEIGVYHDGPGKPVVHVFAAKIVGGTLHFPEAELLDAQWLTFQQIQELHEGGKLRGPWIWHAITDFIRTP